MAQEEVACDTVLGHLGPAKSSFTRKDQTLKALPGEITQRLGVPQVTLLSQPYPPWIALLLVVLLYLLPSPTNWDCSFFGVQ